MNHVELHEPDPEFAQHLEWQVKTEIRRAGRFATPDPSRRRLWGSLRLLAAIGFALTVGACGAVAVQKMRRLQDAGVLLSSMDLRRGIAESRVKSLTLECDRVERLADAGLASRDDLDDCQHRRLSAQVELGRLECDAAEITVRGTEPSNRLTSDRPGGRDFVRERLLLARSVSVDLRQRLAHRVQRDEALYTNGVLSPADLKGQRTEYDRAYLEAERCSRLVDVRDRYVAGSVDAPHAELEAMRISSELDLRVARQAFDDAQAEASRTRDLAERGLVSAEELRHAEQSLAQARAAATLAQSDFDAVDQRSTR